MSIPQLALILAHSPHFVNIFGNVLQLIPTPSPTSAVSTTAPTPTAQCKYKIYIGAKDIDNTIIDRIKQCFQEKNISTQQSDATSATHHMLLLTEASLKSKDYMLPLIPLLDDPLFKQRIFPVNMDPKMPLYKAGEDTVYLEHWDSELKKLTQNTPQYNQVKSIKERIAPFVRTLRDILVKDDLNTLLNKKLTPITDAIEKRAPLLKKKPFFYLPNLGSLEFTGRDDTLTTLASLFNRQAVVTITGESGIGKTALAREYAIHHSDAYPSGIFWINAKDEQTLNESYRRLAAQLGTSVEAAKNKLNQTKNYLIIFDNVTKPSFIPSNLPGHTLVVGIGLSSANINLKSFSQEEAKRYVVQQLGVSEEDASLLAQLLENHPGLLAGAVEYIRTRKISIWNYGKFYVEDRANLMKSQAAILAEKQSSIMNDETQSFTSISISTPSAETLKKFNDQSVPQLSNQMKNQGIQIFFSYNWGTKDFVAKMDTAFTSKGIKTLRDDGILNNFDSLKEFMKKVIRDADYTFCMVTDGYLKSFNCIFEIVKTMEDPHWKNRVLPIVVDGTNLEDAAIKSYQDHWSQEAKKLEEKTKGSEQIDIMKNGAKNLGIFLRFVRDNKLDLVKEKKLSEKRDDIDIDYQASMALMLARQEVLEKKGLYKQEIFHLPMGRNKNFVGRVEELIELEKSLKTGQFSAITNTGIGGIGKTQLALKYAYEHEKEYKMIYWIRAENMDTIKTDLRMLGQEMGISEEALKDQNVISNMKDVLQKQEDWLLIFDNAEDPKALAEVLPEKGGHILVTSRNPNWKNTLNIDVFSEETAVSYLKRICGSPNPEEQYKLLAKELGYLPLALAQAAAYIKQEGTDIATFLKTFKEKQSKVLSQKVQGYPEIVGTIWQMSMEKISKKDPYAAQLLNICSFLAPDHIPEKVLKDWLEKKNGEDTELKFQDALWLLESYALINQKVDQRDGTHKKWISLHRLIQAVTSDKSDKNEAKSAIEFGIQALAGNWGAYRSAKDPLDIGEHAQTLISHAQERGVKHECVADLAYQVGLFFHFNSNLKKAKEFSEKALAIAKFQGTDIDVHMHMQLGDVLKDLEDFDGAKNQLEQASKLYVDNKDLSGLGECYTELGIVLNLLKRRADAKIYFEGSLQIHLERLKTIDEQSKVFLYERIGYVLIHLDRLDEAKSYFEKVLKAYIDKGDTNSISLAEIYHAIGAILERQEKWAEATTHFKSALNIYDSNHRTDFSTAAANTYINLGCIKFNQNDLVNARLFFEKAASIYVKCMGNENHMKIAEIYVHIGDVLKALNNQKEATLYYSKADKIKAICKGNN